MRSTPHILGWTTALLTLALSLASCNTMRYVPQDRALLRRNVVEIEGDQQKTSRRQRVSAKDLAHADRDRCNETFNLFLKNHDACVTKIRKTKTKIPRSFGFQAA